MADLGFIWALLSLYVRVEPFFFLFLNRDFR